LNTNNSSSNNVNFGNILQWKKEWIEQSTTTEILRLANNFEIHEIRKKYRSVAGLGTSDVVCNKELVDRQVWAALMHGSRKATIKTSSTSAGPEAVKG
jgi:hypothetical protein